MSTTTTPCPKCGRRVQVSFDGLIAKHRVPTDGARRGWCTAKRFRETDALPPLPPSRKDEGAPSWVAS